MLSSGAWRRILAAAWLSSGAVAGVLSWALGQSKNLAVFRHAATGLLRGDDLYAAGFVDYFKYSPTFALLFVPLAKIPEWAAAALWGVLNFAVAFAGIEAVARERRRVAHVVALAGVLLATDGDQSNLFVAGAMLLAFAAIERGRWLLFAALVALATHVKIFPIAAASFALLHPRWPRALLATAAMLVVFAALPLVVVGPTTLAHEYAWWAELLSWDHAYRGWSLMTMLELGLGARPSGTFVQALGVGLLAVPVLAGRGPTSPSFRRLFAASVLVFSVLFNHRAEYATFVLSAIGVGLWYAEAPPTPLRRALVVLAVVAHGPFLAVPDASVGGALAFLAAHRVFHPLRVLPLTAVWTMLLFELAWSRFGATLPRAEATR